MVLYSQFLYICFFHITLLTLFFEFIQYFLLIILFLRPFMVFGPTSSFSGAVDGKLLVLSKPSLFWEVSLLGLKFQSCSYVLLSALKVLVYQSLAPAIVQNSSVGLFFWPRCAACGDLGIKLASLAMKVWSPNHWTAGEFPVSPVICYFVVISPLSLECF